jgi:hypothetical protein
MQQLSVVTQRSLAVAAGGERARGIAVGWAQQARRRKQLAAVMRGWHAAVKAYSDEKVRIVTVRDFGVGDELTEPLRDARRFPSTRDCSPYRGLRVRRWGSGFAHRSRASFCRAVPNPKVLIRNCCIAVRRRRRRWCFCPPRRGASPHPRRARRVRRCDELASRRRPRARRCCCAAAARRPGLRRCCGGRCVVLVQGWCGAAAAAVRWTRSWGGGGWPAGRRRRLRWRRW